jgi:hypothetical protein
LCRGSNASERRWLSSLADLNGRFEKSGSELAIYIAALVVTVGLVFVLAAFTIKEYLRSGRTSGAELFAVYGLEFLCLSVFMVSRVGVHYKFSGGTVSAFNTWGRLMGSENLTGLVGSSVISGRGTTVMRLRWSDRRRSLVLFDSLRDALEAATESADPAPERLHDEGGTSGASSEDGAGPFWVCPECHEQNPGNFDECWKCLRDRAREGPR